tara:strand:- start:341 stop:943 length:603 start_codon:yes stop_codon:yes gene_type:complete
MFLKKGAMFGLDARIALAIFGALAIISGAALYSAIQESKAIQLITQANELAKAWEQYYIDTGVYPPTHTTDSQFILLNLLENDANVSDWNGPYLSNEISPSGTHLILVNGDNAAIRKINSQAWGLSSNGWQPNGICTTDNDCFLNVALSKDTDNLATIIDRKIDNNDGGDAGKFRWWTGASPGEPYRFHFQFDRVTTENN